MIHLSYTNRTLSFILYSLYNVHATCYTLHSLHETRNVNDHLRDRSSSSSTDDVDVDVDADADEVVEAADDGVSAAADKKKAAR